MNYGYTNLKTRLGMYLYQHCIMELMKNKDVQTKIVISLDVNLYNRFRHSNISSLNDVVEEIDQAINDIKNSYLELSDFTRVEKYGRLDSIRFTLNGENLMDSINSMGFYELNTNDIYQLQSEFSRQLYEVLQMHTQKNEQQFDVNFDDLDCIMKNYVSDLKEELERLEKLQSEMKLYNENPTAAIRKQVEQSFNEINEKTSLKFSRLEYKQVDGNMVFTFSK